MNATKMHGIMRLATDSVLAGILPVVVIVESCVVDALMFADVD